MNDDEYNIAWKAAIEKALDYLNKNQWNKINNSIGYDVLYDGKLYPPKEVYRKAIEFYQNEHPDGYIPELYGGIPTNDFIKHKGFIIIKKSDRSNLKIDVKQEFKNWLINDDSQNYFSSQFNSSEKRLYKELSNYEKLYKDEFGIDLFTINPLKYNDKIDELSRNVYDKNASFYKYSAQNASHMPRALVGKQYIRFLKYYCGNHNYVNIDNNIYMKTDIPLNQIFYGPPGTGKTFALNQFIRDIDSKPDTYIGYSTIYSNKNFWHLAPGENGYLWDTLKNSNKLGYEWCSKDHGDLNKLDRNKTSNYSIKSYFSHVKKGDYLCIISGKKFYGIATALHSYDYDNAIDNDFDFQTVNVEWIKQFDIPYLLNTYYTPTFGRLNGGRRWDSLIAGLNKNGIYLDSQPAPTLSETISKSTNYSFTTFHQSFAYEDFIEGIKPDLEATEEISYRIEDGIFKQACDKAANLAGFEDLNDALHSTNEILEEKFAEAKPFYLFIDEINRGNISAIFGELITLLEQDKRLGASNEIRVVLPYSKTVFSVPQNLYIIGTMNTADRSVEALDTALRRRFSFTEMMPKPHLLEKKQFNNFTIDEVLKIINERIEVLLDRDHAIGHSYFMKVNSNDTKALADVFKNCIIPLLQEYFYHDYEKIALILGEGFVTVKSTKDIKFAAFPKGIDTPETANRFELISSIAGNNIENAVLKLLNKNEQQ